MWENTSRSTKNITNRLTPVSKKNLGKVLVLGGCSFLGSHVTEGLLESGFTVRIFDKLKSSNFHPIRLSSTGSERPDSGSTSHDI